MEPIDATMTISADRWLMWSEQWNPIVGPPPNETMPHINTSTDVLCKNCISNYDTMACIRSIALCTLSAITAILCGLRIIRLHTLPSPCYHRLILFYVLLMHALLGYANVNSCKSIHYWPWTLVRTFRNGNLMCIKLIALRFENSTLQDIHRLFPERCSWSFWILIK
jgi:hypothetical protein